MRLLARAAPPALLLALAQPSLAWQCAAPSLTVEPERAAVGEVVRIDGSAFVTCRPPSGSPGCFGPEPSSDDDGPDYFSGMALEMVVGKRTFVIAEGVDAHEPIGSFKRFFEIPRTALPRGVDRAVATIRVRGGPTNERITLIRARS